MPKTTSEVIEDILIRLKLMPSEFFNEHIKYPQERLWEILSEKEPKEISTTLENMWEEKQISNDEYYLGINALISTWEAKKQKEILSLIMSEETNKSLEDYSEHKNKYKYIMQ